MGWVQDAALPATAWRPWSAYSRAEVVFLLGEQPAVERIVRRLFGRMLHRNEYAGLAGAPDSAKVEIGASDGMLYIEMRDPVTATCGFYYVYCRKNLTVLRNDGFQIQTQAKRRRGLGLQMFRRQAHNAAALGVDWIKAIAGRNNGENGYYTWPRYGFQGRLPAPIRRFLPASLGQSHTVLDLMACEKGRDWWKEHGVTIPVQFDLAYGSRSRRTLVRYVRERFLASGVRENLENVSTTRYGIARR